MKREISTYCPIGLFSKIFDDKWKLFIVFNLTTNHKRFKDLCDVCSDYMTQKTLSVKLKELEENGIIIREVFAEVPPRVQYSLSEKGKELIPIIESISLWGEKYFNYD